MGDCFVCFALGKASQKSPLARGQHQHAPACSFRLRCAAGNSTLSGKRTWADLDPGVPDGICLDAEGAIWVADPIRKQLFRVHEGGRVSERIPTFPRRSIACMLGGDDRRTLFVCTSERTGDDTHQGRIESVEVAVPGAGLP